MTATTGNLEDIILDCFGFDAKGNLIKKKPVSKFDSGPIGRASERLRKDGYKDVKILGKRFLSHRVIWLLYTGKWPVEEIDHINFDRSDNRVENLRQSTLKQNRYRTSATGSGKSKSLGVKVDSCGFYVAKIGDKYLGYFRIEKDAALAYNKAALEMYGEFAKLNEIKETQEK